MIPCLKLLYMILTDESHLANSGMHSATELKQAVFIWPWTKLQPLMYLLAHPCVSQKAFVIHLTSTKRNKNVPFAPAS